MSYIGKSPSFGVRQRYYFTATGGETSLSGADDNSKTLIFSDGEYIDVYLNGVLLVAGTDYVTTTTNTISSLAALAASDIVEVVVYDVFSVANAFNPTVGGTFTGGVTMNEVTFNKAVQGNTQTASVTGSTVLDFDTYQNFVLTLTGNTTLANPSTEAVGQSGFLSITQTAGYTLSLGTDYETAGGAGITLSASGTDLVPYLVIATDRILLGAPQLAFA